MKNMLLIIIIITFIITNFLLANENSPIKMAGFPAPSPDSKKIAFCYQGDIWLVSIDGGKAERLTIHQADEKFPQWSPDGKEIAFSSDRFGNDDIYVISSLGGVPQQLTFFSSDDRVCDWSHNGNQVYFTSKRDFYYHRQPILYQVEKDKGGTPTELLAEYLNNAKISLDGNWIAFSRGSSNYYRKHYRGSSNTDIWLYHFKTKQYKQLTTHNGNDSNPMWSSDSKLIFYISDQEDDTFNIWQMDLTGNNKKQLTHFKHDGVQFPNISRNGKVIAFEKEHEIWTMSLPNNNLKKLEIFAPSDLKSNLVELKSFTDEATEIAISPTGKEIAFVVRGEIFVVKLKDDNKTGRTTQLTKTSAREREICWSIKGDSLFYVSDRNGNNDIFMICSKDTNDKALYKALNTIELQLTDSKEDERNPKISPNGKKIAYIRGLGNLQVMEINGKNDKCILTGWDEPQFAWSPDSKWIAYSRNDNEFNSDIFIIPESGATPINITKHPDNDLSPIWSQDGRKLCFVSRRFGNTMDIWFVFLQKKDHEMTMQEWEEEFDSQNKDDKINNKDKKSQPIEVKIDYKDIHKRLRRVTSLASSEGNMTIAPDGKTFAFSSNADGQWNLYTINWDGTELKKLTTGKINPSFIQYSQDGKKIYYLSKGKIHVVSSDGKDNKNLPFNAKMKIDYLAERAQKFDEAWRLINNNFYDPQFHGISWKDMKKKYRPLALESSTTEQFNNVIRQMLGELNASHLGFSAPQSKTQVTTGMLGLRFDESYKGRGLKVETVMPEGPCDHQKSKVIAEEIIISIDDNEITSATNIYQLLNNKVGEIVIIEVQSANSDSTRKVQVRPISPSTFEDLEYNRWVNSKREIVEQISKGKLGYVHIQSMSSSKTERFEMELYSVAHDKEGLIIDVRNNPGGSTTDYLLAILAPKPHAYTIPRGGGKGYPQDRLPMYYWSKPIVVMCNEWSFSNAEIFSHAIKGLGRGKVVGAPTGGMVISTGGTQLIDGSWFRIPFRGWYAIYSGLNQENNGCIPDIIVWDEPGDVAKGIDRQLEKAIETLLNDN